MSSERALLILGLGNVLCSDDGLGITILSRLDRDYVAPPGVELMDGGTLGLSLLPELESSPRVILIDAVNENAPPGTFVRLEGTDVLPAVRERLSPHQIGVADLMDAMRLRRTTPRQIVLLGLVPKSLEMGIGCTPPVLAGLGRLTDAVIEEATRMGYALMSRRRRNEGTGLGIGPAADVLGL